MSYYGNLYQNEELSHRAKTVYMYLHDRSDAAGACWPGVKRIASDLKLSRRTVQRLWATWSRQDWSRASPVIDQTAA